MRLFHTRLLSLRHSNTILFELWSSFVSIQKCFILWPTWILCIDVWFRWGGRYRLQSNPLALTTLVSLFWTSWEKNTAQQIYSHSIRGFARQRADGDRADWKRIHRLDSNERHHSCRFPATTKRRGCTCPAIDTSLRWDELTVPPTQRCTHEAMQCDVTAFSPTFVGEYLYCHVLAFCGACPPVSVVHLPNDRCSLKKQIPRNLLRQK